LKRAHVFSLSFSHRFYTKLFCRISTEDLLLILPMLLPQLLHHQQASWHHYLGMLKTHSQFGISPMLPMLRLE
jgi:hypothetical protein